MKRIRVVLADDHPELIRALRFILDEDFDVVAEVNNGNDAVAAVIALDPDVLIIDISMPGLDGIAATRQLKMKNVRAKIIILTMSGDAVFIRAGLASGASAYIIKSSLSTDLLPAIDEVLAGNIYVFRTRT